jgi:hypothetical protein
LAGGFNHLCSFCWSILNIQAGLGTGQDWGVVSHHSTECIACTHMLSELGSTHREKN